MIYQSVDVKNKDSQDSVRLQLYLLDSSESMKNSTSRPIVLICPGGGYEFVSDREAEPIAMRYLAAGMHAAILYYSVAPARFPTALLETAESVIYLRTHAQQYHIDPNQIILEGFSAGGHLAASYGVFWKKSFLVSQLGEAVDDVELLRPNGLILGYPVITSGEHAHRGSFNSLLGERRTEEEMLDLVSLEKQVNADVPRTFLWHTQNDGCVPVENSLLFANALQKQKLSYELHIYPYGPHGLALANEVTENPGGSGVQPECQEWMDLSIRWIKQKISN